MSKVLGFQDLARSFFLLVFLLASEINVHASTEVKDHKKGCRGKTVEQGE
jgi:hypothetical protein